MYVHTYAEQISLDELPANTPHRCWSNSIQFHRFSPSSPLLSSFVHRTFFLFFSPGLHLRPARSTYSLENDKSSVDFTRGGFSLGAASILPALSATPFPPPLLLCSLMRGRDHLEYNFASFRIIIDFVSRSSFLFFSFFFLPNIFQFLLPPSLLLSNNHRLIDYYTRYTDGKYVAKYPRIGREAKWSIIQFKQARLFVQWLVQVAGTRIGHSLINPFGNRIRRRLRLYPAVCVPPSCPPCLVHPGQLITVVWIHLVHRPLLTTVADHRVCLSAFRPNYGNTPLYDAMITTANRLVPRFN